MRKALSIIVSAILVALLCVTGVFAENTYPSYTLANCTVAFFDSGFILTPTGSSPSITFSNVNSGSMSCDISFSSSTSGIGGMIRVYPRESTYSVTYSELSSNLTQTSNNLSLSAVNSGSTEHFELEFDNYNSSGTGMLYFQGINDAPTSFTFSSLVLNGDLIISGSTGEVFNFTLSPGYALVINGPCEISDRTYSISGSWNFDRLTNSRINGSFERVVQTNNIIDGFSPDRYLTIEQLLPWWADNSNALGVASNYSYHNTDVVTLSDAGINYVLGYPLYYQGSGDYSVSHENAVSLTGSIYFQYSGTRPTISKIAIESLAEIVDGHYHYYNVFRPDVYDESGEVVSDGQGGTVVEFPDAPSGGGNSGQPPVNEETNLFGVLSKFVNDIKNLISQGSHAISELVNYGSSFMHSIAQMYDWLPATLTTLIVTAFSIVLVIGVIKLLWK